MLAKRNVAVARRGTRAAERTATEISAAILLVRSGEAGSVKLTGLPSAARLAGPAAVHARASGVGFRVERGAAGGVVLHVGPRLAP